MPTSPYILMGRIVAAHGIKGEVKVISHSADPSALLSYPLCRADGTALPAMTLVRADTSTLVARVTGISDRNGAEALRGTDLYAPRDALPPPDADEVYHADLIGLPAHAPNGTVLGRVTGVVNFGASDLLEIDERPQAAGSVYIPLTREMVPHIAADHLIIDAPADYWV